MANTTTSTAASHPVHHAHGHHHRRHHRHHGHRHAHAHNPAPVHRAARPATTAATGDRLTLRELPTPAAPSGSNRSESRLQSMVRSAATRATKTFHDIHRKCYKTAALTARLMGGDLGSARRSTSARGLPISHLAVSEQAGNLKPGMIIYVNRRPGTDPRSVNLANKPHWFTYIGRDQGGQMRFSDQYSANFSLADMQARYGRVRRIDTLFDPLATRRV